MQLHLAYLFVLYVGISLTVVTFLYKLFFYRYVRYMYPLTGHLKAHGVSRKIPVHRVLSVLRFLSLLALVFLASRPQWIDETSAVSVKGVDIVLALDVSGSMEAFDDLRERMPRVQAMKREALQFITKRTNDPIGVVLFAKFALSRVPLTLDKKLLKDVVRSIRIGDINPEGTALKSAVATSINRLRVSDATSKVIILLTDGMPSDENLDIDQLIRVAKEHSIKIYTLGVGKQGVAYAHDGFGSIVQIQSEVDEALLNKLASQTGGQFYRVHNPTELAQAYSEIDALEKTTRESPIFHHYYEAFASFMWIILLLLALEFFLRAFYWRGVF